MVETKTYTGEISKTVYKVRVFVPVRIDDIISRMMHEKDVYTDEILRRFIVEMTVEPKLTKEVLEELPADEIQGLTIRVLEDTKYKNVLEILQSGDLDKEKIKKIATDRFIELKKKVN